MILDYERSIWTSTPVPIPLGGRSASVADVSCPSQGACVAVGSYASGQSYLPLILSESDGTWADLSSPAPHGALRLDHIVCPDVGKCVATGDFENETGAIEPYFISQTGAAWSASVPSDEEYYAASNTSITALACPTAEACIAVGQRGLYGAFGGLIFTQSSGDWTASEAPAPSNYSSGSNFPEYAPSSLSCPEVGDCVAVGTYSTGEGANSKQAALILESTNGRWSAIEAPHSTGATDSGTESVNGELYSVACPDVNSCVAVGPENNSRSDAVLLERLNGTWLAQAAPLPAGGLASGPLLLACPAPEACAVATDYLTSYGSTSPKEAFIYQGTHAPSTSPIVTPPAVNTSGGGDGGSGGDGTPSPSGNPCVPSHGSLIHEMLASIKCEAHELKLETECGVNIVKLLYFPFTKLKLIEEAKSARVIATLPVKLRPTAQLIYDLAHFRYLKHAPRGFRDAAEAIKTIRTLKWAYQVIERLPDMARA